MSAFCYRNWRAWIPLAKQPDAAERLARFVRLEMNEGENATSTSFVSRLANALDPIVTFGSLAESEAAE